nr:hypothetical protein [Verrucomicrobium sp. 3C]
MEFPFRFAGLVPSLFCQFGFSAAQLALETVRDQVDRLVEVVSVVFGVKIWSGEGEMDFNDESLLVYRSLWRIVLDRDMGSNDSIFVALELL